MAGFDFEGAGTGLGSIAGIGLGIYVALQNSKYAKEAAEKQKDQARLEMEQNKLHQTSMELSSRRAMMEQVRTGQVARSMALSTAQNQGAQFSSGLSGAYGSIAGGI